MAKDSCGLAVFPGTFDPLTTGHVSLVRRGLDIFQQVVVAVACDTTKKTLFSHEERVDMAREVFADYPAVTVEGFSGLTVAYAKRRKAVAIMRGLRAVSDFEYEFQMALMNRRLEREVQTVFLMTDYKWMYLSSTIVKEAARHGGNIKNLVPDCLVPRIYSRFAELAKDPAARP